MKRPILFLLTIVLLLTLNGCVYKKNDTPIKDNGDSTKTATSAESEKTKSDSIIQSQAETTKSQDPGTSKTNEDKNIATAPDTYIGIWLDISEKKDIKSKDDIMHLGGRYLEIKSYDGIIIKGTMMSISAPPSNRIASIDFKAAVTNNKFNFSFDDDGFGNAGTGSSSLSNNEIVIGINITKSSDGNWSIGSGNTTFRKLSDSSQQK